MRMIRLGVLSAILAFSVSTVFAATTFTVNDPGDAGDGNKTTDPGCGTTIGPPGTGGPCTLRAALEQAAFTGSSGAPYTINFSGVTSITIGSPIDIREQVILDGGPTKVTIDGNSTATGAFTMSFNSGGSTIKNLIIINCTNTALDIGTDGNAIQSNFIGTDGLSDLGNGGSGISVSGAFNIIGGPTPITDSNVISGNTVWGIDMSSVTAFGNVIQFNFIGTDVTGQNAIGNDEGGIHVTSTVADITLPSVNAIAANVISGNGRGVTGSAGISMSSASGTLITANYIGVQFPPGLGALPNDGDGIYMSGSTGNGIGGITIGDRNVISGNNQDGIEITSGSTNNIINGNFIGLDSIGVGAVGNGRDGIFCNGNNNIISGVLITAPQHIAGNVRNGITVQAASGNQILTNNIGENLGDSPVGNGGDGIQVNGGGTGNLLSENDITNSGSAANDLGIDLIGTNGPDLTENTDPLDADTGSNNLQNRPLLTTAVISGGTTTVSGTIQSLPSTNFTIEFFTSNVGTCDVSGFGEGEDFDSSQNISTDAAGNATFSFPLSQSGLALGTVVTATLTETPANNTSEFSNCALVAPASADVGITKTDSPDPVTAGTDLTYTITVNNTGPGDADNVAWTDPLPAGTTFVSLSPAPPGWSCTTPAVGANGTVNCSILLLPFPSSVPFTLVVHVDPAAPDGSIINNTATVATTTNDPVAGNNNSLATTTVAASADLSVTKSDSPDPVIAGNNVTYTVTVTNNGPSDAVALTLTDLIPVGTTFVSDIAAAGFSCTDPGVGNNGPVTCTGGTLISGASAIFTIVVKTDPATPNGTTISNTANVGALTTDPDNTNNVVIVPTLVNTEADLAITKADAPDPVTAGSNITYTIVITNNGPSDAQTVALSDNTPANTTFVSLASPAGYSCTTPAVGGTGAISCSNTTTIAGGTDTFTLVVNVNPATPDLTIITNTATATSATTDPTPGNNSVNATTTVSAVALSANVGVTKTDSPDPVDSGANITYTITVTNSGPDPAANFSLTDNLPAGTTFVSLASPAGYTCSTPAVGANGTVTCLNPSVPITAGDVFTLVVKVDSATGAGVTISNTATVASATSDPDNTNDSATAGTLTTTNADIGLAKTDAPDPVLAGGNITYTVTATNSGPSDAAAFVLNDTTPANTTFVSVTPAAGFSCTDPGVGNTGAISCSGANIVAGGNAVFTIVVNVNPATPAATVITNNATYTDATTDPNAANDVATATTTVSAVVLSANLSLTKSDNPDPVNAGANLTYTITLANLGPDPAANVVITDNVPANTTFVSLASAAGYTCTTPAVGGTGLITCSNPSVPSAANDVFTLTVNVGAGTPAASTITNTANVTSTTSDPNNLNNVATATTTVAASADLAVTKTDAPDPVLAGGNITYTIQVSNAGPSDATSFTLADTTPANTTFVSLTAAAGYTCTTPVVGGTGPITCTNPTVLAGANDTFTLVVQVGAAVPVATAITNTATVTSATPDAVPGNNSATATTTTAAVVTSADLSVTKTDAPDPVAAGGNITYTIAIANGGPDAAASVIVADTVPANTTFVSLTSAAGFACTTPAVGGTGPINCTNALFANGASGTFTLVVKVGAAVPGGTTISNTATISSATTEPTPGNNSATATTTVSALPINVPAMSGLALMLLAMTLAAAGWFVSKR